MAHAAEEVGFDSVWLGDHMLYRGNGSRERGPWDVWTLLAGLAASTERVALGPLVACTAFHPPGVLASMAACVDEISGGRLVLALGAGWNEAEFRAFDVPFDSRVSRFAEAFEIIRRLLAGEHVTTEGRFHHVQDAVLLPRPRRRLPLMVGTTGPRMLALTLPYVDAWNSWYDWYGNTPEGFWARNAEITRAARDCGRDPAEIERSACVLVAFGDPKERPAQDDAAPVRLAAAAAHLRALAQAGADEAIVVLDPIDEESIRALRPVLAALEEGA
jgi:alkanesulfonate monooxygenase SsuD/methylene tetrahydromethanopterin reductase-like flavin-dependent oxidoreductase (luciferase family)